jgi:hypothetical protein
MLSTTIWWTVAALLVLWVVGVATNFGGSTIHVLLTLAVVLAIANLVTGRTRA